MRFVDKSFKLWRLFIFVQIVDVFVREHKHGRAWPIFVIDALTTKQCVSGISLTIPVAKITIAIDYSKRRSS